MSRKTDAGWVHRPGMGLLPGAQVWSKDTGEPHGAYLSVIAEPSPWGYHLSISHRVHEQDVIVPGRYPTWDEIVEARYLFCPAQATMAQLLPPREQWVNLHETTFHLWEVTEAVTHGAQPMELHRPKET